MFQPAAFARELNDLAARYGPPRVTVAALSGDGFDPLGRPDRVGEVCMVVRRPNGRLLTARKTYYPPEAYRLLTGGIGHGEPVAAALLREVDEETGLHVQIARFLAAISYTQPGRATPVFHTFAFLLDETGGNLAARDPAERIADFRAVLPADLPTLALGLETVADNFDSEINGNWRNWGRFRAVVHREVYAALTAPGDVAPVVRV